MKETFLERNTRQPGAPLIRKNRRHSPKNSAKLAMLSSFWRRGRLGQGLVLGMTHRWHDIKASEPWTRAHY